MKIIKIIFFLLSINFFLSFTTYPQNGKYIILISFDAFRWDYPDRGLTPNLDFIKNNGVKALSLKPCFPSKTFPNHYSIVTGLYPQNHGIIANNIMDPANGNIFKLSDTSAVRNPKWFKGEAIWETARRQGVITASYFWPGSELNLEYRRPNYYEKFELNREYDLRIKGVLDWLSLPYPERPKLVTAYFEAADTYGHRFGPDSKELNMSITKLDSVLGKLIDGLKQINLYDSTDIILVSDHGMTNISGERVINVQELLGEQKCTILDHGPVMYLFPDNENEKELIYEKLKSAENHFTIYKREEIPDYYHFSESAIIPDLLLVADMGWSLITNKELKWYSKDFRGGNHGYDNNYLDMHGIFFAIGPDFKQDYKTGTLENIDIYPLLANLLHIIPNQNIDGNFEHIKFILKKY